jgi:hypothetical protein
LGRANLASIPRKQARKRFLRRMSLLFTARSETTFPLKSVHALQKKMQMNFFDKESS